MLNLIPLPYRIIGAVLAVLALFSTGFATGAKVVADRTAARQLEAERLAAAKYQQEVERGNTLSAQLATAENQIQTITLWKARNVQNVTTGKSCLGPAAVGLLNGTTPKLSEATGKPSPEDAGTTAATDSDTLAWAIEARSWYATCAARVNSLVDYENGRK